jgi:hypothetical protein
MAHRILSAVRNVPTLVPVESYLDREDLRGASDLLRECRELLRGERTQLTPREVYVRARLAYWRARATGAEDSAGELAA